MMLRARTVFWIGTIVLQSGTIGCQSGDRTGDANKTKLIGTWVVKKDGLMPKGSTAKLAADGKLSMEVRIGGLDIHSASGQYRVEGNTLHMEIGEETSSMNIERLTTTDLIIADGEGKKTTFAKD